MIDPRAIEIPTLKLTIPEPVIDWAYQAYTGLVLDVVELELEKVPGELDSLWTAWGELHDRLWSAASFDLVSSMGYRNVLAAEKGHELERGRALYASLKGVFAEALRTRNLRLYLSTRLEIERQRQERHNQEQGLLLEHAKATIEATVTAYNLAVEEFKANIAALELEEKRWSAVTAINEVELKKLEKVYTEAKLANELIEGEIRRQRALAGVLQAAADVQRLEAEIELNGARVQIAEVEVQRLILKAFLVGTQQIEEQAQALSLQVDAAVIRVEGGVLKVLAASNEQVRAQIENVYTVKNARDAMYATALAEKEALLVKYRAAQQALIDANREYAYAQGDLAEARNQTEITRYTSGDVIEDARTVSSFAIEDAQFDAQNAIEDARFASDREIDEAKTAADGTTTRAKMKSESALTSARYAADTAINSAKLEAEITTYAHNAAYHSALTVAETQYKMAMEAEKLGAEITIALARIAEEVAASIDSFSLSAQKSVSEWSVQRDQDEVTDKREEVQHSVTLEESNEKKKLAEARVSAAEYLKSAKVINRFTEYR